MHVACELNNDLVISDNVLWNINMGVTAIRSAKICLLQIPAERMAANRPLQQDVTGKAASMCDQQSVNWYAG